MRLTALEFKNNNSDTIYIDVDIVCDYRTKCSELFKIADIRIKPYRKQKWISVTTITSDDYLYRSLSYDEQPKYLTNKYLEYATKEQLKQAILNAYEEIKPDIDSMFD